MKRKITYGFVVQTFDDDGKFVEQEFIAGDQVEWEDKNGNACDSNEDAYHNFDMNQS